MRRHRASQKASQLPSQVTGDVTAKEQRLLERLPWPLNKDKPPRWGEGVPVYIPPTEDEKAAMAEL